jgi:hypothetical protein
LIKPCSKKAATNRRPWSENRHSDDAYRPKSGPCDAAVPLLITDPPVFSEMPRGARIWLASAAGGSRNNSSEALCPAPRTLNTFARPREISGVHPG